MTNDVLRLKNDVLNELRNEKYYVQDDLRIVVESTTLSQKDKVSKVIEITSKLVNIDAKIVAVDAIFQAPSEPTNSEPEPELEPAEPTNIVEPVLNQQGQTHAE